MKDDILMRMWNKDVKQRNKGYQPAAQEKLRRPWQLGCGIAQRIFPAFWLPDTLKVSQPFLLPLRTHPPHLGMPNIPNLSST